MTGVIKGSVLMDKKYDSSHKESTLVLCWKDWSPTIALTEGKMKTHFTSRSPRVFILIFVQKYTSEELWLLTSLLIELTAIELSIFLYSPSVAQVQMLIIILNQMALKRILKLQIWLVRQNHEASLPAWMEVVCVSPALKNYILDLDYCQLCEMVLS